MNTYDIAVAGAGVFGAWTALRLRQLGCSVALFDPYGPGNSRASSGGESRIIRMGYGPDDVYTKMSIYSLAQWKALFAKSGERLFHQSGVLWIAPQGDTYALRTREVLQEHGVAFDLLSADDLSRRFPQVRLEGDPWGLLEVGSGALIARRAVHAVAAEAVRLGVEYIPQGLHWLGDGAVTSAGQRVHAGKFVFASGPWLPKLFPELLGQRIHPTRQEVFFFGTPAGDSRFSTMPICIDFTDARKPYFFPDLESRGFKIAIDEHGPEFDPDSGERTVTVEGLEAARRYLGLRLPDLVRAPMVESRVCQYENTSRGDFLIDRHPETANVWLVGGGSGHGFKHGPAVGDYAATRIVNGDPVDTRFSLATKEAVRKREVF